MNRVYSYLYLEEQITSAETAMPLKESRARIMQKYDPIRCIACAAELEHTESQHEEYLLLWCEEHQQWCGDHNQIVIKEELRNTYRQMLYLKDLERSLRKQRERLERHLQIPLIINNPGKEGD
jgi:hypothetical protein